MCANNTSINILKEATNKIHSTKNSKTTQIEICRCSMINKSKCNDITQSISTLGNRAVQKVIVEKFRELKDSA